MRLLTGSDVLTSIRDLAGEGRRVFAAVAYVGPGAAQLLPLGDGDTIVVNGSRNALVNGATSAVALRSWCEAGAHVLVHETLHAKIVVVGRTAIVGSANLSERAATDGTIEAAVLSTERSLVAEARVFVRQVVNQATAVDDSWLEWAHGIPVRAQHQPLWSSGEPFLPTAPYDLWFGQASSLDWTEEEVALAAGGIRTHRVLGGRYRTVTLAEERQDTDQLAQPDMVVVANRRSTRLLRFLERRVTRRAAIGFYREDRRRDGVRRDAMLEALGIPAAQLPEVWQPANGDERRALIQLFGLPDLPARRPDLRA